MRAVTSFLSQVGEASWEIISGWDRFLVAEIVVIIFLATILGCAGVPIPTNITIACGPIILFNLGMVAWNLR